MNFTWLKSKVCNYLYFLVFFLLLFTPISGFPVKISAEGVEPLQGRPIATVKDIALSNALKTAIENAAKEISPNLGGKSLQKLRSEDPLNYIKAYRILYEISIEEEYKITIETDVDSEKLKNRLEGFAGISSKPLGKPSSVSIVVLQSPQSDPIIRNLSLTDVRRGISVALIGAGYKIVEPQGDVRLEAYVNLKTTESKIEETMYYALGSVFIRAKDKDGKVITEVSESVYSNGANLSQIGLDALKEAGAKAAEKLKSELDKRWNTGVTTTTGAGHENRNGTIEISFSGLRSYSQYEQLNDKLSIVLGIDGINERIFRYNGISFLVLSRMSPEELAKILEKLNLHGFSLKLDNASLDKIEFSVQPE
jgi:hypothetical protein